MAAVTKVVITPYRDDGYLSPSPEPPFIAFVNPQDFTKGRTVSHESVPRAGQTDEQKRFVSVSGTETTIKLLFDNTIVSEDLRSVAMLIDQLEQTVTGFIPTAHALPFVSVVLGKTRIIQGAVKAFDVDYQRLDGKGNPTRALATLRINSSLKRRTQAAINAPQSPDLTHTKQVPAGGSLVAIAEEHLGTNRAPAIARFNRLPHLNPPAGTTITVPPLTSTDR